MTILLNYSRLIYALICLFLFGWQLFGSLAFGQGKPQLTYDEVFARVTKGERLTLAVGPYQYHQGIDGWVEKLPGVAPGVYECYRESGVNKMRPATNLTVPGPSFVPPPGPPPSRHGYWAETVPGVTVPSPFHQGREYPLSINPSYPGLPASPEGLDGNDALAEVNTKRAGRGLRPYLRDEGLTQAAKACAAYRARNLLFGHTDNDFAFCPPGVKCDATGCAAYPGSYGWMSCAVWDNYTHAGAAYVVGRDGKRYMHLFVRR